jgi:5S rRNA maturation endonuclease (ribonuclease M5)
MPVQSSLFGPPPDESSTAALLSTARLHGLIDELVLLNEQFPVVVEGARDVAALRTLGLRGRIIQLHCGRPIAEVGETISREWSAVIILLDWDRRGRQLEAQLTRHLDCDWEAHRYVRQELMALCKASISTIEEVPGFLAAQAGGSLPAQPAPRFAP